MYVDFDSRKSIEAAAALKAHDVMSFYHGHEPGKIPGVLSTGPEQNDYIWWEAGAMWGTMIDYWRYTGDASYNDIVQSSLLFQAGPDRNYMPPNVSAFIGNDDQSFWGLSAMLAAESNFPNPPPEEPQWLALAQAVFNTQTGPARRDGTCGGGLRWQVFALNKGYDYKNAISNGLYFNLAARLAHYTGNATYALHAAETFAWMQDTVGLIDGAFNVYDGAHVPHGCRDINPAQFSYNVAVLLQGAAFMYDHTGGDPVWAARVDGLLGSMLRTFFVAKDGSDGDGDANTIAFEPACEDGISNVYASGCTLDMVVFKGFGARWMADTAQLCPWTRERIMRVLRASAEAAVRQCTGGGGDNDNGRVCGMHWSTGTYDGFVGVGQELNVLSALMVLLAEENLADSYDEAGGGDEGAHGVERPSYIPLTHDTGGTSEGNPDAGGSLKSTGREFGPITDTDTSIAVFLTTMVILSMFGIFLFMSTDAFEWHRIDKYSGRREVRNPCRARPVSVNAPLDWVDLEERRPSRRASPARARPLHARLPIRPAKTQVTLHGYRRATIYREGWESAFGDDEASGVDGQRQGVSMSRGGARNSDRTGRKLHSQSIEASGGCQRRDAQKLRMGEPSW